MLRASGRARGIFFELAGMQDKQKGPPAPAGGPSVPPSQNGTSSEARSGVAACAGTSASARFNRRTALARTLQEIANFAALAFLGFPLSRSYLELTSCPSKRTRSPLCSVSATDSPRRLKARRCQSTFETHSSSAFFQERWWRQKERRILNRCSARINVKRVVFDAYWGARWLTVAS